jgi:periplasmic protein TonB
MTDRKLFSGSLRRVSLADVFQLLGGNSFTGILNLRSQFSEYMGIIYFMEGNPINGYFGDLKGLDAVYAMFGLTEGNYEFYEQPLTQIEPIIKQGRMQIVLNALRMLDEGNIKKIGPVALEQTEVKKEEAQKEAEKKPVQPVEDNIRHVCFNCKTLLYADDTKVFIGGEEYCFQCAIARAFMNSPSTGGAEKNNTSNDNSSKEGLLAAVISKDKALPEICSTMDISVKEKLLIELKSLTPFKYCILASSILVWVVLGIILYGKFNQSSQNPEFMNKEQNSSRSAESSGPVKIGVTTDNQTAPVADNAGSPSMPGPDAGQARPVQTAQNKPAPGVNNPGSTNSLNSTSGQETINPTAEKKSTSALVDKAEKPIKEPETVAQKENSAENNAANTAVKEVEPQQTTIVQNEVKEIQDSAKLTADSNKAVEKAVAAKPAPPAIEPLAKEQISNQAVANKGPEFPGGKAALTKWLNSNITFPPAAARLGTNGYVIVELTIDPVDGKISNATIVRSLQKQCDQEVLRLVSKMPNWKPAEINGVKTASTYMLSVRFALQ